MSQRSSLLAVLSVTAVILAAPVAVLGQSGDPARARTPWGDPDLHGIWTSSTYTPLERPDHLAGREFLTEEEHAELNLFLTEDGVDPLRARSVLAADSEDRRRELTEQTQENIHYDNAIWLTEEQPRRLTSTSLHVPDRRPADRENPATHARGGAARGGAEEREPLAGLQHRATVVQQLPDPHAPGALSGLAPRGSADAPGLV